MTRDRVRLVLAFAAIYVIWGSTYLAIRWAIDSIPPFLMAGARYLVAGVILYLWGRTSSGIRPTGRQWRDAAVVGGLLLLGGNGGVVWAEQTVPSGLAALLVALEPVWVVLLDWLRPGGIRPTGGEVAGLVLGFGGVVLLVGPANVGGPHVSLLGALVLVCATLSWASGSLYSRHADMPRAPLLATGMNMLAGSALLILAGTVTGQWSDFHPAAVTLRSLLALLFLIFFGAIMGFTAYLWVLRHARIASVSTYAYVNPIIAVFLGWALASELITPRIAAAAGVIVASVVIITTARTRAFQAAGSIVRRAAAWVNGRRKAA